MTFRQMLQTVLAKARALWAALWPSRNSEKMPHHDPIRLSEPYQNGDAPAARGDAGGTLHGGPADWLPVAARRTPAVAPRETATDEAPTDEASIHEASVCEALSTEAMDEVWEPAADLDAPSQEGGEVGLSGVLESLLFVAGEPVEVATIAKTLEMPTAEVEQALARLAEEFKRQERGLRLQVLNGKYQLVTAPAAASYVEAFLNLDFSTKLSSAALETLAVVAYRQPVTRAQIEAVRGVDCAAVLRSLIQRGLIEETGRLEAVGRPILYGVTDLFMQHFGLMELGELPPLAHEDEDLLHAATALAASASAGHAPADGAANPLPEHMETDGRPAA